jgi:hypothetical protein
LVVGVDSAVELLKTDITGFNGPPLAYVQCGEQMLDARTSTPTHIAAKIMEKYEVNREKSHAFQLRRGSSAEDELNGVEDDSIPPEISVPASERQFSVSKILKTPPLKFLNPSPNAESKSGRGDDTPSKGGKQIPKASPCRLALPSNELDAYRLTPSRATKEKDKSWFG